MLYRILSFIPICFTLLLLSCASKESEDSKVKISVLQGFPQEEPGIEEGVSACYVGVLDGKLLMAGGCNFPDVPASEGGAKQFYKGIYLAEIPKSRDSVIVWRRAGELPIFSAYGISLTTKYGVVCIGGTDGIESLNSAFIISSDSGGIKIKPLPTLPYPLDNMGGALYRDTIYVAGGNCGGKPSNRLFSLSLDNLGQGWTEHEPFPGLSRLQPVCAVQNSREGVGLYVWGGFSPSSQNNPPELAVEGCRYDISSKRWDSISFPVDSSGESLFLGGGSAVSLSDSLIVSLGGVNQEIFLEALQREHLMKAATLADNTLKTDSLKKKWKEYMLQPQSYYKFNPKLLLYNTFNNEWYELASDSALARAGVVSVAKGDTIYSIGGELKPGIRTPSSVMITIR